MAGNRFIHKLTALLLILVFTQKMGMSLYLHNWLHAPKQRAAASKPISNEDLKFACSCISDFTLPLTEPLQQQMPLPMQTVIVITPAPVYTLPSVYKYFHSLRAPPVSLV